METLRNPLLASVPCGRVGRTPLRVGLVTIFTLLATIFAFPAADEGTPVPSTTANAATAEPTSAETTPSTAKPEAASDTVESSTPTETLSAEPTRGFRLGLAVALVLFGSSLLHEIAEAAVASRAGGEVAAIVLWPVGGRTVVTELDGAGWMQAALAGPAVHTVLCLLTLPAVVVAGATDSFSLTSLPVVSFDASVLAALALIVFSVNLKLLAINLLPLPPLDGSRFIRGWRLTNSDTGLEESMTVGRWAMGGLAGGMSLTTIGLAFGNAWITAVGALLLACACTEVVAFMPSARPQPSGEESIGGYDFSQGYTSLDREFEDSDDPPEPTLGPLARWKAKKEAERLEREERDRIQAERELDRLLAKVGEVGMAGLTAAEKSTLTKLSERLKSNR